MLDSDLQVEEHRDWQMVTRIPATATVVRDAALASYAREDVVLQRSSTGIITSAGKGVGNLMMALECGVPNVTPQASLLV